MRGRVSEAECGGGVSESVCDGELRWSSSPGALPKNSLKAASEEENC